MLLYKIFLHAMRERRCWEVNDGRGDRIRTCDLFVPNEARYQSALHPEVERCASYAFLPTMQGQFQRWKFLSFISASVEKICRIKRFFVVKNNYFCFFLVFMSLVVGGRLKVGWSVL